MELIRKLISTKGLSDQLEWDQDCYGDIDGSLFQYPDEEDHRRALLILFEVDDNDLSERVTEAATVLQHYDKVICLTTSLSLSVVQKHNMICEMFPSIQTVAGSEPNFMYVQYLKRRFSIVLDKWRPDYILQAGLKPDSYFKRIGAVARQRSELD